MMLTHFLSLEARKLHLRVALGTQWNRLQTCAVPWRSIVFPDNMFMRSIWV